MTDLRQLMQQALDAWDDPAGMKDLCVAMDAIRTALAQPEMQPCAGRNCGSTNLNLHSAECFEDYEKATGMRAWHGLTDEEMHE